MPHTLVPRHGNPGYSKKFQIAPHNQAPSIIWIQKRNPNLINKRCSVSRAPFPLSLKKVPVNEPRPSFPSGGTHGESRPFPQPSFTCLSNVSIKFLAIETKLPPSVEGLKKGASPHVPPKRGFIWKQTPISRAVYLAYRSGPQ